MFVALARLPLTGILLKTIESSSEYWIPNREKGLFTAIAGKLFTAIAGILFTGPL